MKRMNLRSSIALKVGLLLFALNLFGCSHSIEHQFGSFERDVPIVMGHNPIPQWEDHSFGAHTLSEKDVKLSNSLAVTKTNLSHVSREDARVESVLERIAFKNHLYLAKDGSLLGDFTLHNQNTVPISNISIECSEYNPQHVLLRTTSRVLKAHTTLLPYAEQRFEQIDFGYVENDFDTVNCRLLSARAN